MRRRPSGPRTWSFVYHDPVCEEFWPRLTAEFASLQFILYEDSQDRFLAVGNTIPFDWSGRDQDLPDRVPAVLVRAFHEAAEGISATSLCRLGVGKMDGLSFPETGRYVVRGALNPVVIDRDRDEGVLTEPNVWMVHAVDG